jgi:hypothetical protein
MNLSDKERRRKEEMDAGRNRTIRNMAEAIIEQSLSEMLPSQRMRANFTLVTPGYDPRSWEVEFRVTPDADPIVDNFFDFPSDNMKATIALLTL